MLWPSRSISLLNRRSFSESFSRQVGLSIWAVVNRSKRHHPDSTHVFLGSRPDTAEAPFSVEDVHSLHVERQGRVDGVVLDLGRPLRVDQQGAADADQDRKSTRLNSSH